ncbi:MAG: apolipoprotein N-acyltransferase [Pseudomonadota bacterium]
MLSSITSAAQNSWRWVCAHPGLSALVCGVLSAFGFPPIHAWWLALPAIAAFVLIWHEAPNARSAAWRGWLFGWAHLTLANNWIATAFTHQAKMPEFLGWLAVPLLCVYLAAYPALAALAAHLLGKRAPRLAQVALFAGMWIAFEWLRATALTGYPWPPLGLVVLGGWTSPGLAVLLPYLGTYALSGLVIIVAGLLSILACSGRWLWTAALVVIVAVVMHFPDIGSWDNDTKTRFTLVQPYIPQDEINDGSKFEEQFQRIARLTAPESDKSRVVLWPESAIPDFLEDGYPQRYYNQMNAINPLTQQGDPDFARRRIGDVIGDKSTLLTGVVNLDIDVVDGRRRAVSARNSVLALNGEGSITHHYAKAHLVPYGEYLPMRSILEPLGLSRLVAGTIDYLPGPGPRTLDLGPHGKVGVQICYEIVFSGQVVDRADRPGFIFNPSNDGWFGSWGPPQHLAQARMRAIEEGLPVLRSTTTGISAVIDANGSVRQHVPMGEAAALEGFIPPAHPPTPFARLGNALPLAWAVLLIFLGLALPRLLALRASRSYGAGQT